MSKNKEKTVWSITDHICMNCGGRILQCESPIMSPGGGPLLRCASCGASGYGGFNSKVGSP